VKSLGSGGKLLRIVILNKPRDISSNQGPGMSQGAPVFFRVFPLTRKICGKFLWHTEKGAANVKQVVSSQKSKMEGLGILREISAQFLQNLMKCDFPCDQPKEGNERCISHKMHRIALAQIFPMEKCQAAVNYIYLIRTGKSSSPDRMEWCDKSHGKCHFPCDQPKELSGSNLEKSHEM